MKCLLICSLNKQILWVSPLYPGHVHDFTIFKQHCAGTAFSKLRVHVDLGFLGIHHHIVAREILIPHKNYRKRPLTDQQKAENTARSRLRVVVENVFAKMKSFFVLRIKNRMKDKSRLQQAIGDCALLSNFKSMTISR